MELEQNEGLITLPLNISQVQQPVTTINRAFFLFRSIFILAFLYHRVSHRLHLPLLLWLIIFISELLLSLFWLLGQGFLWRPIRRNVFPERLGDVEIPAVDVFICTTDPKKEPTFDVMNTVISALCLDHSPEKLCVYLSDDGGSSLTLFGIREAYTFAKSWLPFCNKYGIQTRCPMAYFDHHNNDDSHQHQNQEFMANQEHIKIKYELFKERVERAHEMGVLGVQLNTPLIEVINNDEKDSEDYTKTKTMMPLLVYVAREKKSGHPHHFKAGALNVLLRISSILSNAPYILVLDCDTYCNDPTSPRQAMCFFLDPQITHSLAFVQYPQMYYNVSKNDIYDGQLRSAYKTKWQGMDGICGPILVGTGFYMKRHALYGSFMREDFDYLGLQKCFGSSSKFIESLSGNYTNYAMDGRDSSSDFKLLEEAQFLASCSYEKGSQWGNEIGFLYHCLLESGFIGYYLHCNGWTSAYIYPSRPAFLGCTNLDLNDTMAQGIKWNVERFKLGISRFSAFTYALPRMLLLQTMCYGFFMYAPLCTSALLFYASIPQICLLYGISLYPKVSDPWFVVYSVVFVSFFCQHLFEVKYSGGSLRMFFNEVRMLFIRSIIANPLACLYVIMELLGLKKTVFTLSNKATDKEKLEKYEKGKFDFQMANLTYTPMIIIIILNMVCFVAEVARTIVENSYDEMLGQNLISFVELIISYPIIEEMIRVKKKK